MYPFPLIPYHNISLMISAIIIDWIIKMAIPIAQSWRRDGVSSSPVALLTSGVIGVYRFFHHMNSLFHRHDATRKRGIKEAYNRNK